MIKIVKNLVFSLIPLIVILAVLEVGLRIAKFEYSDTPIKIVSLAENWANDVVGGYDNANTSLGKFVKDKHQFWVPDPSFEDSHAVEKDPNVTRIATLGCSCTQACALSGESYPRFMEQYLNEGSPEKYEVLNAGVGGHSSHQGLARFKHAVLPYKPDIITIFFGWNDHWVAQTQDKDIRIKSDLEVVLVNFFERFRFYHAYHYLLAKILQKGEREEPQLRMRVDPLDYKKNLEEMVKIAKENNMKVVLHTAPSDFSDFKPFWNFPYSKQEIIKVHETYNQMVRVVAAEQNVTLIDLSREMATQDPKKFFSDGVHFTPKGCRLIAAAIAQQMHKMGVL